MSCQRTVFPSAWLALIMLVAVAVFGADHASAVTLAADTATVSSLLQDPVDATGASHNFEAVAQNIYHALHDACQHAFDA